MMEEKWADTILGIVVAKVGTHKFCGIGFQFLSNKKRIVASSHNIRTKDIINVHNYEKVTLFTLESQDIHITTESSSCF